MTVYICLMVRMSAHSLDATEIDVITHADATLYTAIADFSGWLHMYRL
jgi:hypothetical protein